MLLIIWSYYIVANMWTGMNEKILQAELSVSDISAMYGKLIDTRKRQWMQKFLTIVSKVMQ